MVYTVVFLFLGYHRMYHGVKGELMLDEESVLGVTLGIKWPPKSA